MAEHTPTQLPPYSVRLTQSAKGFWYVDKIQVDGATIVQVEADLAVLISKVKAQLDTLNQQEAK